MSEEKTTPEAEAEEAQATPEATPAEGSESKDEVSDEQFLERVNEIEGRDYKSVEDYKKTVDNRNKEFSQKGQEVTAEADATPATPQGKSDRLSEEVLISRNKNREYVMEDAKKIAQAQGQDLFTVFDNNEYLDEKAQALADKEATKKEGEENLSKPASQISGTGGEKIDLSDTDRKLMSKYKLSEEDVINKVKERNG